MTEPRKSFLTNADVTRLENLLNAGDRAAVYKLYYDWTGSEQAIIQAQITTFSGMWGAGALLGNVAAKLQNPLIYQTSLDSFSADIVKGMIETVRINIQDGGTGILSDDALQNADRAVWSAKNLGDYFPGNIQLTDVYDNLLRGDFRGFSAGTINGLVAGAYALGGSYGKYAAEFDANPAKYIREEDSRFIVFKDRATGRTEGFFDKNSRFNTTENPASYAYANLTTLTFQQYRNQNKIWFDNRDKLYEFMGANNTGAGYLYGSPQYKYAADGSRIPSKGLIVSGITFYLSPSAADGDTGALPPTIARKLTGDNVKVQTVSKGKVTEIVVTGTRSKSPTIASVVDQYSRELSAAMKANLENDLKELAASTSAWLASVDLTDTLPAGAPEQILITKRPPTILTDPDTGEAFVVMQGDDGSQRRFSFGQDLLGNPAPIKRVTVDGVWKITETENWADPSKPIISRELATRPARFEDFATAFGSTLSRQIAGSNVAGQIVLDGVLRTGLAALGQYLDKNILKAKETGPLASKQITDAWKLGGGAGGAVVANIASAGVGALSSYLTASLFKTLGINGTAGDLASQTAGAYVNQILTNLITTPTDPFKNLGAINPLNIAGSFFGSKLASAIVKFDTVGGQIGSSVGSSLGALYSTAVVKVLGQVASKLIGNIATQAIGKAFGWAANFLIPGIGAFIGFILGGLIGSIFGGTPRSGADVVWDEEKGAFSIANIWSKKGGSKDAAKGIAGSVSELFNGVITASGGKLLQANQVRTGTYGMRKKEYVYQDVPLSADSKSKQDQKYITAKFASQNDLIEHGAYIGLSDIMNRLAGGDILIKRSIWATLQGAGGSVNAGQTTAAGQFEIQTLSGNISTAQDYRRYLLNGASINAQISAQSDNGFAAGWAITLARADELGLNKRAPTDWVGGFNLWMDEQADGRIDGNALSPATIIPFLNPITNERLWAVVDAKGRAIGSISDTISGTSKDRISGASGNDTITVSGDTVTSTAGLTINGAAPAASTYKIAVAAVIDGGAGDDVIRGGDLGNDLLGGAGNDTLVGGKLDDWLLGQDGNDRLFAGNVVTTSFADTDSASITAAVSGSGARAGGNGNLLDGGAGDDRLYGGAGSDWLIGGSGTDRLYGGGGGDILDGGADALDGAGKNIPNTGDTLEGGGGSDQYLFGFGDGTATIFDDATQGSVAGSSGDSLNKRIVDINSGALQRNWAGGGDYTVDGSVKGGEDAIAFKAGVTFGNIILERSGTSVAPGQDLIIRLVTKTADTTKPKGYVSTLTGDTLVIKDWFEGTRRIEWLRFANGDDVHIGDFISFKVGTAGADVIVGTNGADFIYGGDGNDKLFGLAGDDFGNGGIGNDLVSGDDDNDLVLGGENDDKVLGGKGHDTVFGDEGNDDVYGGDGNDIVVGGQGSDQVMGGAGNDVFRINRGDGRDTLIDELNGTWELVWDQGAYVNGYAEASGKVSKGGVVYFDGSNWIGRYNYDQSQTGTFKQYYRFVPAVGVSIVKNAGTDTLEFGVGIDIQDLSLRKLGNNLEIAIGRSVGNNDNFDEIADRITMPDWFTTTAMIENFQFLATGQLDITGYGLSVQGTDNSETLNGTASTDWITGNAGDDVIFGDAGNDILNGNSGRDELRGSIGSDVLYGGNGDDVLDGGASADILVGGLGSDTASYKQPDLSYAGLSAFLADTSFNSGMAKGDNYTDIENIEGTGYADHLGGDDGDNVLTGGYANDVLSGGAGNDIYVINSFDGDDVISDAPYILEEIITASGSLATGYTANWSATAVIAPNSKPYYRLLVTKIATGEVVYDWDKYSYPILYPAQPLPTAWDTQGWKAGFYRNGDSYRVIRETAVAGNGGTDDSIEFGEKISLAQLSFAFTGNHLGITYQTYDGTSTLTIKDQKLADRKIEWLVFDDGLSVALSSLVLSATGTAGDDFIHAIVAAGTAVSGGDGNDVIFTTSFNATISGGNGDDIIEQMKGYAVIDGGAGVDTYRVIELGGAVTIDLALAGAQAGAINNSFINIENLIGTRLYADTLRGSAADNQLAGLGGDDLLDGRDGNDVLDGGLGNDSLYGGAGDDNITGSDGNDYAEGGLGKDLLFGGDGVDTLKGDAGNDTINGGGGDDINLFGGADDDSISGDDGNDVLYGEAGNDKLVGGLGNDTLDGGADNDILAGDGLDALAPGNDILKGGFGDDSYVFFANAGQDQIIDAAGDKNVIQFTDVTPDQLWLTRQGNDLRILVTTTGSTVLVKDYYAATSASRIRVIKAGEAALFLNNNTSGRAYAEPLISAMTAAGLTPPAVLPVAVTDQQTRLWWTSGKASPTATDVTTSVNEKQPNPNAPQVSGSFAAVDQDENIPLTGAYSVTTQGTKGVVTVSDAGIWIYKPTNDYYNGSDSFQLKVTDADGQSATKTVNVTILPVNSAPNGITLSAAVSSIDERDRLQDLALRPALDLATVSVSDPDGPVTDLAAYSFSVSDSRFEVDKVSRKLRLKQNASLDFEAAGSVTVTVTVTVSEPGTTGSAASSLSFVINDKLDIQEAKINAVFQSGMTLTGQDSRVGLGGQDRLIGYAGNNSINGLSGNDELLGGAGNDTLNGGSGNDSLYGEADNDTLNGDDGDDTLDGGLGDDILSGGLGVDMLNGGDGLDRLRGGDGNDTLLGLVGDDMLFGDVGSDTLRGGDSNDTLVGGANGDVLDGSTGNDTASYYWSSDGVAASAGVIADLTASANNSGFAAGDTYLGIENLTGSDLADTLSGDGVANQLIGNGGNDILNGLAGDDRLEGGLGADTLNGGVGSDTLLGGIASDTSIDTLMGGDGHDILDGGQGNDILDGGEGNDRWSIYANSGSDTLRNRDIDNNDSNDIIVYEDRSRTNLWFERVGNNLVITVVGTSTVSTVENFYVDQTYKIDFVVAGTTYSDLIANQLVTYMAGYAKPTTQTAMDTLLANTSFYNGWNTIWQQLKPPTLSGLPASQTLNEDGSTTVEFFATSTDPVFTNAQVLVGVDGFSTINAAAPDTALVNINADTAAGAIVGQPTLVDAATGKWRLVITPRGNASGAVDLRIRAKTNDSNVSSQTLRVNVTPVADVPTLSVPSAANGTLDGGATIAVNLLANVNDMVVDNITNQPEQIDLFIVSNVPADVSFNQGVNQGGGVWHIPATRSGTGSSFTVPGLTMSATAGRAGDLSLSVVARAKDGASTALSASKQLNVVINTKPIISAGQSLNIAESTNDGTGSVNGASLGIIAASDADSDPISFAFARSDAGDGRYSQDGRFELNPLTGLVVLRDKTLLNFEDTTNRTLSYNIIARDRGSNGTAGDGDDLTDTKAITINVTDINEKPSITGGTTLSVSENSGDSTYVGTVTGADVTGESPAADLRYAFWNGSAFVQYSPNNRFYINPNSGNVFVAGNPGLNYESGTTAYGYTVAVYDRAGGSGYTYSTTPLTINVADVNEAPSMVAGQSFNVSETALGAGNTIIGTLLSNDPDTLSAYRNPVYSIASGYSQAGLFSINSSGQLLLTGTLNFEALPAGQKYYDVPIIVTDQNGSGLSSAATTVRVNVIDVNEPPVFNPISALGYGVNRSGTIRVGSTAPNSAVLAGLSAVDPDTGNTVSYQITNVSARSDQPPSTNPFYSPPAFVMPSFSINSSTGVITKVQGSYAVSTLSIPYLGTTYLNLTVYADLTVKAVDQFNNPNTMTFTVELLPPGTIPPIVLDLDGDGVELTSFVGSNVRFDMDGDGAMDQTGWAGADDGILALDRNANGVIDTINEISFASDLSAAVSDLEGLRAYDSNTNGYFDDSDAQYADFRVWKDANQNGISEAGELLTLSDAGVRAINLTLNLTGQSVEGAADNVIYATSEYVRYDGTTRDIGDVFFAYAPSSAPAASVAAAQDIMLAGDDAELKGSGRRARAPSRSVVPTKPAKPTIKFAGVEAGAKLPTPPADVRAAELARAAPAAAPITFDALSFAGLPDNQVRELATRAGYNKSQIDTYLRTGKGLDVGTGGALMSNIANTPVSPIVASGQSGGGTVVDSGVAYDSLSVPALAATKPSPVVSYAATPASDVGTGAAFGEVPSIKPLALPPQALVAAAAPKTANVNTTDGATSVGQSTIAATLGEASAAGTSLAQQQALRPEILDATSLGSMLTRYSDAALAQVESKPNAAIPTNATLLKFLDQMAAFHSGAGLTSVEMMVNKVGTGASQIAQLAAAR
jgi:Ca2+-binding RTX toxin-like protein